MWRDGDGCDHAEITRARRKLESRPPEVLELLRGRGYRISGEGRSWEAWGAHTVPREGGRTPLMPCWGAGISNRSAQLEALGSFTTQSRCHRHAAGTAPGTLLHTDAGINPQRTHSCPYHLLLPPPYDACCKIFNIQASSLKIARCTEKKNKKKPKKTMKKPQR